MINRRMILRTLTKARLWEIARVHGISVPSRLGKEQLVRRLSSAGAVGTSTIVESLRRKELKLVCRRSNLDDTGKTKAILVNRVCQEVSARKLKSQIVSSLRSQGFAVQKNRIALPADPSKEELRDVHALAVSHRIERARPGLVRHESALLEHFANGGEVQPEHIKPELMLVTRGSEEELLFRYASLHWSIPVSSGYGRRLRFLVVDQQNRKLIGIIGLGDPVFSLAARDAWIDWNKNDRAERLRHVMDAFVLGAVPPYSKLLCGKLVAMLAASNEVRKSFRKKYQGKESVIRGERLSARLALITTASALGRSSIYNRLKYGNGTLFKSVGFTRGSGEFHFFNGLYGTISKFANDFCEPTAKQEQWGTGFRSRREVVRKCLANAGLSAEWIYHGIRRELFVVPLAANSREFLRGEHFRLRWFDHDAEQIFAYFRERWLLPRAERVPEYRDFDRESYRLWPSTERTLRTLARRGSARNRRKNARDTGSSTRRVYDTHGHLP